MNTTLPLPCVNAVGMYKNEVSVDIEDVCFMLLNKSKIVVHTIADQYYLRLNGPIDAFAIMFAQFGFEKLDSGNIVNLKRITHVSESLKLAYFDNKLHTTISRGNFSKVRHIPKIP